MVLAVKTCLQTVALCALLLAVPVDAGREGQHHRHPEARSLRQHLRQRRSLRQHLRATPSSRLQRRSLRQRERKPTHRRSARRHAPQSEHKSTRTWPQRTHTRARSERKPTQARSWDFDWWWWGGSNDENGNDDDSDGDAYKEGFYTGTEDYYTEGAQGDAYKEGYYNEDQEYNHWKPWDFSGTYDSQDDYGNGSGSFSYATCIDTMDCLVGETCKDGLCYYEDNEEKPHPDHYYGDKPDHYYGDKPDHFHGSDSDHYFGDKPSQTSCFSAADCAEGGTCKDRLCYYEDPLNELNPPTPRPTFQPTPFPTPQPTNRPTAPPATSPPTNNAAAKFDWWGFGW